MNLSFDNFWASVTCWKTIFPSYYKKIKDGPKGPKICWDNIVILVNIVALRGMLILH